MASISWPGGTLANVWAGSPAERINSYEPSAESIGPEHVGLGTGATHKWEYRVDYTVSCVLTDIPVSSYELCLSLQLHLSRNKPITLTLNDPGAHVYTNLAKAPEAKAPRPRYNRATNRLEMAFELINLDAAPILADYQ